jgi:hypothetical protein
MKTIKRRETTIETGRAGVIRRRRTSPTACCAKCGPGFRMVAAFAAAALADVNSYTIYRWAETGEIHFSVTDDGALLVCLDSLYAREGCGNFHWQPREQQLITLHA